MKKRLTVFILLFTLIFTFTSCKNETKEKTESGNSTVQTESLRLQMRTAETLDPLTNPNQSVCDVLALCYDPLFTVDENIAVQGVLAQGWEIDDTAKTVTVKLKENILWHDGKLFTSGDVIKTVEHIKNNPESPYSFNVKYIESVTPVDTFTVRFNLSRPYAQFIYSLYFPIIAAHSSDFTDKIMGTGAYMLDSYVPDSVLKLTAFRSWHGGTAALSDIEVSLMRDSEAATSSFNSRMVNAVTSDSFDLSNYALKKNMRTAKFNSANYEYMAFNHNKEPFNNKAVRSAISTALNRSAIADECYNLYAEPANLPVHPVSKDIPPSPTFSSYDLNSALEMLFYEGYSTDESTGVLRDSKGNPFTFTLLVNEENTQRCAVADTIVSQLLLAGITVKVQALPFDKYTEKIASGQFDAYLAGTKLGNLYDFEFLLSPDGKLNNYGYSGRYTELALSEISASPTRDSFRNAAMNFGEIFYREQPVCGIVFQKNVLITSDNIKGMLSPQLYSPYSSIHQWDFVSEK